MHALQACNGEEDSTIDVAEDAPLESVIPHKRSLQLVHLDSEPSTPVRHQIKAHNPLPSPLAPVAPPCQLDLGVDGVASPYAPSSGKAVRTIDIAATCNTVVAANVLVPASPTPKKVGAYHSSKS